MERAAILIGVKKTGDLPELHAVETGIQQMADWVINHQRIPPDRVRKITDEGGREVRIHQITDVVEELVGLGVIEQLIVYFSGHGINNRGEHWLLSRAPGNQNEAVNVEGSLLSGRHCGIPHIVLISDACRTAAEGIEMQNVTGSELFPNEVGTGLERWVDVFFACARGKPALEIKDPNEAAKGFSALYTDVLVECLKGEHADILDFETENGSITGLVRPRKLRDEVRVRVSKRLRKLLKRAPTVNQTPDARIVSENTWLSRIPGLSRTDMPIKQVSGAKPVDPFTLSEALVSSAVAGETERWNMVLTAAGRMPAAAPLKNSTVALSSAFGPSYFESGCGFKIRGAQAVRAVSKEAKANILDGAGTLVRIDSMSSPGSVVLLEFRNGTGVLLPAIPYFLAEITFEGEDLVNISYEPSEHSPRWGHYADRKGELRTLRASIAASAGLGVFQLTGDNALKLARRMQVAKGIDPSLALYAAYAYHDLQKRDLIQQMGHFLYDDLEFVFFDVALLSARVRGDWADRREIAPLFPMLSQGWTLLSAFDVKLPGSLQQLHQYLMPSLWTLFDRKGVATLTDAIMTGEIR